MKTLTVLLISCVLSMACLAQTPDKNQWGEKFNSNGAQLVFKELGRDRANGQTVITYRMFASGLPKDAEYSLWTRVGSGDPQGVAAAYINKDSLLVNVLADPAHNIAEDPINLKVVAGKGEPKQFALVSSDGHYRVFGQVVPFPIENTAGPCHISVVMLAANYSAVRIVVDGLQPKEELQIDSQSEAERGGGRGEATDKSSYTSVIFPQVKGKRSGKTRFDVTAKSCRIGVEFPWGESSYSIQ